MIVRITQTTIDPSDADAVEETYRSVIKPAFESFDGCERFEMGVGIEERSGDLAEIVMISHWSNLEAIEAATHGPGYRRVMEAVKELFQQSTIVHHFHAFDR